jgi:hypothetical protein
MVRMMHKFDFKHVTNAHLTNGDQYLFKKNYMMQQYRFMFLTGLVGFPLAIIVSVNGLYPTLRRSTAFSCVIL